MRIKCLEVNMEKENDFSTFDIRVLGDSFYDGMYITDGEGITLYVNSAYTKMTEIKKEDIIGKSIVELEGRYFKNAVSLRVIEQKKIVASIGESLINHRKMLVTGCPIFDENGNVYRVVVNNRDITDTLLMKEELEHSKLKIKTIEESSSKSKREIEYLREQTLTSGLIGSSREIRYVIRQIHQVADTEASVLITGETGVGKEIVANEIYENSRRYGKPFIKVNCAAIPKELVEAELFGYEKGAFTGASPKGRIGLFELVNNGTILLDEVGELPLNVQAKLLRVLQSKELLRVGGSEAVSINPRVIASTNRDLRKMIGENLFREDLYYRLNVFPIYIPPLRERLGDIPLLVAHFLDRLNKKYNKNIRPDASAISVLFNYSWPGNVRELENIIERLVIINEVDGVIDSSQLANLLRIKQEAEEPQKENRGLYEILEEMERKLIFEALETYGTTRKAAAALKVNQSTIVKKAKKLNINLK